MPNDYYCLCGRKSWVTNRQGSIIASLLLSTLMVISFPLAAQARPKRKIKTSPATSSRDSANQARPEIETGPATSKQDSATQAKPTIETSPATSSRDSANQARPEIETGPATSKQDSATQAKPTIETSPATSSRDSANQVRPEIETGPAITDKTSTEERRGTAKTEEEVATQSGGCRGLIAIVFATAGTILAILSGLFYLRAKRRPVAENSAPTRFLSVPIQKCVIPLLALSLTCAVIFAVVMGVSCSKSNQPETSREVGSQLPNGRRYFPMQEVSQWIYDTHVESAASRDQTRSVGVVGTSDINGLECAIVEIRTDGALTSRDFLRADNRGVAVCRQELGGATREITPPNYRLIFPFTAGVTWKWEGEMPGVGSATMEYEVYGEEKITVPAGTFDSMKVVTTIFDSKSLETAESMQVGTINVDVEPMSTLSRWFVKDVGVAREVLQIKNVCITSNLKKFTIADAQRKEEDASKADKNTSASLQIETKHHIATGVRGEGVAPKATQGVATDETRDEGLDREGTAVAGEEVLQGAERGGKAQEVYQSWTDSTGSFTVEATMVVFQDGVVKLKKKDGRVVNVPLSKLNKKCQVRANREHLIRELVARADASLKAGNNREALSAYAFALKYDPDNLSIKRKVEAIPDPGGSSRLFEALSRIEKAPSVDAISAWEPIANEETDIPEIRILLTKQLVGNMDSCLAKFSQGASGTVSVFLHKPTMTLSEVKAAFGKPTSEESYEGQDGKHSGDSVVYGRFRIGFNARGETVLVVHVPY